MRYFPEPVLPPTRPGTGIEGVSTDTLNVFRFYVPCPIH